MGASVNVVRRHSGLSRSTTAQRALGSGVPLGCSQKVKGSQGTRDVPIMVRDSMGDGSSATGQRTVARYRIVHPIHDSPRYSGGQHRNGLRSPLRVGLLSPVPGPRPKTASKFAPQWALPATTATHPLPPHSRDHAAVGVVVSASSCVTRSMTPSPATSSTGPT